MKEGKKNREDKLGFGNLVLWQSRMISVTIVVLVYTYLMIYCTDTLQIPAAIVSVILVVSKVVDGITDMIAGFIVDKTNTRWGKARPYEIFIVGFWLCTWLLFSTPVEWSLTVKCIWVFTLYSMANAVCCTFLNANGTPYTIRAFKDHQIVKLTSYGSIFTMLAGLIFNIVFPMMMGSIATSAAGWSKLVLMWAVPMTAIGLLRMIFIKEKYEIETKAQKEQELKINDVIAIVKTNKYILLIVLMNFIFNFVANMGVTSYYYTYIVGDIGLMGIAAMSTILALPLAFVFPKLIAKFSTIKVMIAGFLIAALGYLVNFFAGANMSLLLLGSILTGAGAVPASMLIGLVLIECADFNEWKGIRRMDGTMSSFVGLGSKVGAAIGTGALGLCLSAAGYTGVMETMPDSAFTMIRMLFSLIPMALYVLTALSLFLYKLDKLMPQIKEDIKARREKENVQ